MSSRRYQTPGFSLIEVIIAVGIFAVAVSAMLGLLPALTRQAATSADTLNASRLSDAIRVELRRLALAGSFDSLVAQVQPLATPLPATLLFAATRDTANLHALEYQPPASAEQIPAEAQYFLIEAWRFVDAPLAFEAGGVVLALHVRVSWPYRVPGALAVTPLADREQLSFNLALSR
jgi:prepilin-type N-terminal cleavage/methylation domain-containing protein